MEDEVKAAVFGNVGTMITFRVGATDAEAFEKEFAPYFILDDLVNLSAFQVYMRLMIDGVGSKPFSAHTLDPIARPAHSFADAVIANSRALYAKPVQEVTDEVTEFYNSFKEEKKLKEKKDEETVKVRAIRDDTPLPRAPRDRERKRSSERAFERRPEKKEPRPEVSHFDEKPAVSLKDALAKAMQERGEVAPPASKENIEKRRKEVEEEKYPHRDKKETEEELVRREVDEATLRKLIEE